MDIFRFINSKDVRAHLKQIGYEFNTLEAAWLIWQCRSATMKEKHEAWDELIQTMPDMAMPKRRLTRPRKSVHAFLRQYMKLENAITERFFNDSEGYGYQIGPDSSLSEREWDVRFRSFDGLWFEFPTPFQKGDILWNPSRPGSEVLCGGPFVNLGLGLERCDNAEVRAFQITNGDNTDMNGCGWFSDEHGGLYYEVTPNYMDFEFCPEEQITGPKRTLLAASNYVKGKIDALVFARAYHQILSEEYAKSVMPRDVTEEEMKLAGIRCAGN